MNKLLLLILALISCCHVDNLKAAPTDNITELVFIDIWGEYATASTLPKTQYPRQYLQPDLNVYQADIDKFVMTHSQYKNLKIDKLNTLMRKYAVRSTPTIVRLKNGKMIANIPLGSFDTLPNKEHVPITKNHLRLHDIAGGEHDFSTKSKQKRLILFADALCPARHLPACEEKAKQHAAFISLSGFEKLTVIKPFYVTMENVKAYQQRFANNHPVLFDTHNALFRRYKVSGLPYWLLLSEDNRVLYRGSQPPSDSQLAHYSKVHSD